MKRLLIYLACVAVCMVLLISVVMTQVPAGDTLTTKRYKSPTGFEFNYPRTWNKINLSGGDELAQIYSASGSFLDCAFAPSAFSLKSLYVYVSQSETTMEGMKYFTENIIEMYESMGYVIDIVGAYSRFGEHLYYTIRLRADGQDVRQYILISGENMFSFVFTSCSDSDVNDVLSSVNFFVDAQSETV